MGSTDDAIKEIAQSEGGEELVEKLMAEGVESAKSPEKTDAAIEEVMGKLGDDVSKEDKENVKELASKMFNEGMLPKQAMGLTDEMCEGMYSFGYRLYNNGKYEEAAPIFRLLILLDPTQPKYLMGLAACFHMSKEYQNAATTYALCSIVDLTDPLPYYHASDCYLQLDQRDMAMKSLEMSIDRMGDRQEYAALKDRAMINLNALEQGGEWEPTEGAQLPEASGAPPKEQSA